MVMAKKQEKELLKEELEDLKFLILQKEKEILPIYNSMMKMKETLSHEEFIQQKFNKDIQYVKNQIHETKLNIDIKNQEIKKQNKEMNKSIKDYNLHITSIKNEINVNRISHKREKIELESLLDHKKKENQDLKTRLENIIKVFNGKKISQNDKLRKMNNKSKMFIGILKH